MTVPDIVKQILKQEGITQNQLAKQLGVSRQAVFNMLNKDNVTVTSVVKILHAVGYDFIIEKRRNNR